MFVPLGNELVRTGNQDSAAPADPTAGASHDSNSEYEDNSYVFDMPLVVTLLLGAATAVVGLFTIFLFAHDAMDLTEADFVGVFATTLVINLTVCLSFAYWGIMERWGRPQLFKSGKEPFNVLMWMVHLVFTPIILGTPIGFYDEAAWIVGIVLSAVFNSLFIYYYRETGLDALDSVVGMLRCCLCCANGYE